MRRKNRRPKSGLFRKYFLVTISILLVSFIFIGGALLLLVSKLWLDEKRALLMENTQSVAENTADVLASSYFIDSSRSSVIVICNTLLQISNAVDADVFMVNPSGAVVYCKEILQADMMLYTDECIIHKQYQMPAAFMEVACKEPHVEMGTLDGVFNAYHFIVSAPVQVRGETVGVIVTVQEISGRLTPYIRAIFRMFFVASILVLLIAFIPVSIISDQFTRPLRQMSAAARQYANGDFSTRIRLRKPRFSRRTDEIDELVAAFNSMAQALASLEMSRRSFVANVSHELKTPMTTIGGFIDGILDGTIEQEKQAQYLQIVSDEVKRLSRLVTGMLNMSKIEAGELDIKPTEFDLSDMLFRTLLSFEQLIDGKSIEVRGLDAMEPLPVKADRDMINQVVYNLVDNAVKFTPEGGYIEVAAKKDAEKAIVRIRNSGKGIASEELDKIFERFYKVDKSRSYDVKGAGLGLYLVKTIIELHGGQITARSEEGEYTEFIIHLPL